MLTSTMYTMSSMEAAKEDKTCRWELKMQTFMCSCAQWYAWNIFFTLKVYTQKVIIALKMCTWSWTMNYIKNKVNCSYGSIMEKLLWKAFCSTAFDNALFPFNIVDFFMLCRGFLFYCFINQQKQHSFYYVNGGKIAHRGCGIEQIYGCMTSVHDEKIDECHVRKQSVLNL